jgi:NDP-sugar pyrophosphorylase family protein
MPRLGKAGTMMEALLLVGGLGSRLRSELGYLPKPMVDVGGRPFLERLLINLRSSNIRSVVLAVSYGRECIESHFRDGAALGLFIRYSREAEPLGTAGALRNALPLLRSDQIVVVNGDSFVDVDYDDLLRFHRVHGKRLTIVAVHRSDCRDFGRLRISDNHITQFLEKDDSDHSAGYVNGGAYIFDRQLVESIRPGVVQSLETEVFPSLLANGERIPIYCLDRYFMDLGTPERLQQIREDFRQGLIPFRDCEPTSAH